MPSLSFQDIILTLQTFWSRKGCILLQPYDMEMGAGTFNPIATLKTLDPTPFGAAFAQTCRRPGDGRYGQNPNRLQKFHQFQVLLKPSPDGAQALMLESLESLGMDLSSHDIRFVEDNWESPTLGASGLGWEVWVDGTEILQFTYFQKMGGIKLGGDSGIPVTLELTYGLERIGMILQGVKSIFHIQWNPPGQGDYAFQKTYTNQDLFMDQEKEFSSLYFEEADIPSLKTQFEGALREGAHLLKKGLILPAYECCITASHCFNVLDSRQAISVAARADHILKVRQLASQCCEAYHKRTWSPLTHKDTSHG